jgi:FtsP/CotA-like multicopper oxidase with cupredoxin domain
MRRRRRSPALRAYSLDGAGRPCGPFAIEARFDRPSRFVWHGHILSHEDHEMMRPFVVREA